MLNILVLCDDYWHPGEVIKMGLSSLEGDEFHLDFVCDAKDILTPEYIARYPVIINCKGNQINGANQNPWFNEGVTDVGPKEFTEYVENGGGFICLHSGNTAREGEPYSYFSGNYFITHPPRCDVDVRIVAKHPVTEGVNHFRIRDEHYEIKLIANDAQFLFMTTSETGGEQVGGYVRSIGSGRLCALTPGHILSVFLHPEYQKIISNAIRWVAKS